MKISLALLFTVVLQLYAGSSHAQRTRGAITMTNVSIEYLLEKIEETSDYVFLYNDKTIQGDRIVSVNNNSGNIQDILNEVFRGTNITYTIVDKQIILSTKKIDVVQQDPQMKVTGIVKDTHGEPLIGAAVTLKGANLGVVTDIDGNFNFDIPQSTKSPVLVISYIGYTTAEVSVTRPAMGTIVLQEDSKVLDEVVIVSYGTQSKRRITGAIQTVKSDELNALPVAQLTQKLQGKLAGVQINQITGIPGQGMSMRIRGQASITADSNPLFVVDGFPISGDIAHINPDEIESISVLKDASSTSLYGSRAANGVVIVTTRRAEKGASNLSVSAYVGVQAIPERGRPEMMNAAEFAQFKKEIAEENGWSVDPMFQNPSQYGKGTDWFDVITRNAMIQNYSVAYNTSTEKLSTAVTAGFMSQEGVLLNSDYNRFSLRLNSEYRFTDRIRIGFNAAPTVSTNKTPQSDGTWYNGAAMIQGALLTSPLAPYKNEDGTIPVNASGYGTADGPNYYNMVQEVKNTNKRVGLLANAFLEAEPLRNLLLKTSANVDLANAVSDNFNPASAGGIFNPGNPADVSRISASHYDHFYYTWLWENTASYRFALGNHGFDALAGFTMQKFREEKGEQHGRDFPDGRVQTLNAAKTITGKTDIQEWSMVSALFRLNYHYHNKYLLSLAFRTDASSRFGADNRWGNFPSISAGWVVSDENFMKNLDFISFLKLRASYGVTGNNNIGNYTHYARVVDTNYPLNDQVYSGKSLAGLTNNLLGWETTKQMDLGFDINFVNNRINFSYDYYRKTTDDLLYDVEIPISSNFFNYTTNIGKLRFWGHEFTLSTVNLDGDFRWTTDLNYSYNQNKVLALGTANAPIYGDHLITEVGKPIGQLYALIWDGIYMNQEDFDNSPKYDGAQVGMVKYKDIDGDGHVDNNDNDKETFGNSTPTSIFGITNNFAWKNFDLSIVASGAAGHKLMNYQERFVTNLDGSFNVLKDLAYRWRSEENPGKGVYGKVISGTTSQERDWSSSKFFYNAAYLNIRNITLGYRVPLSPKSPVRMLRLYASVQNAFIFTKYPGNNPEATQTKAIEAGIDYTTYPVPRTFSLGINLNF